MGKKRICVVGGGPAGVFVLRALQCLDEDTFEVKCFERHDRIGGQWNSTGREEIEDDRMEPHSAMYHDLLINTPKESLEFPEFIFPDNDPELTGFPSFPDRLYILKHLDFFCEKHNLLKYIQFKSWVHQVRSYESPESTHKFQVAIRDLKSKDSNTEETFDYVIVASGHFERPNYVTCPGQETFPGTIIHSKHFIDAKRFKGLRVLAVGSSKSADEISLQLLMCGASRVTISYRHGPLPVNLPSGIDQRPLLRSIEGSTVYFSDESKDSYDAIVYCTGYMHDFPFMEDRLKLRTTNRLVVPLYKQIVFPTCPQLFYIGMEFPVYTFPLFWLQGHLCAKIITGEIELPDEAKMWEEIRKSEEEEKSICDSFGKVTWQSNYLNEISSITGQQKVDTREIIIEALKAKSEDMITWKQKEFMSSFKNGTCEI